MKSHKPKKLTSICTLKRHSQLSTHSIGHDYIIFLYYVIVLSVQRNLKTIIEICTQ